MAKSLTSHVGNSLLLALWVATEDCKQGMESLAKCRERTGVKKARWEMQSDPQSVKSKDEDLS